MCSRLHGGGLYLSHSVYYMAAQTQSMTTSNHYLKYIQQMNRFLLFNYRYFCSENKLVSFLIPLRSWMLWFWLVRRCIFSITVALTLVPVARFISMHSIKYVIFSIVETYTGTFILDVFKNICDVVKFSVRRCVFSIFGRSLQYACFVIVRDKAVTMFFAIGRKGFAVSW